uniref:CST complex subunit TEN1 n=1 Tax=Ursus americanus TaxID=9643 RepID=A0A452QHX8_URSAM
PARPFSFTAAGGRALDRGRGGHGAGVGAVTVSAVGRASCPLWSRGALERPPGAETPEDGQEIALGAGREEGQALLVTRPSLVTRSRGAERGNPRPPRRPDRLARRLCLYDVTQSRVTLRAQHGSDEHQILVCTKLVEPFQAHVDSLYLVLGELQHQDGGSVVKARVLTCVEGMNLPLFEQAVREQRRYQQE